MQSANRIDGWNIFAVLAALLALALPMYVQVANVPLSDPDPYVLAQLHLRPEFWPRCVLTFLYFPAVIILHLLACPQDRKTGLLFMAGFALFLAGNSIDAMYRAIQFIVVHGHWSCDLLGAADPGLRAAAQQKILLFNDLSIGISASFSLLFAAGRCLMGMALLLNTGSLHRLAGLALIINGTWNGLAVIALAPAFAWAGAFGAYYVWPWLASIALLGVLTWQWARD